MPMIEADKINDSDDGESLMAAFEESQKDLITAIASNGSRQTQHVVNNLLEARSKIVERVWELANALEQTRNELRDSQNKYDDVESERDGLKIEHDDAKQEIESLTNSVESLRIELAEAQAEAR